LAWLQKVAWNKTRIRRKEDEAEFVRAKKSGFELVRGPDSRQNDHVGTSRSTPGNGSWETLGTTDIFLGTPVDDPLSALLPVSQASLTKLHLAIDLESAGRKIGLSEDALKVLRARIASKNRKLQAELLGFTSSYLNAKEVEIREAIPRLREVLSAYVPRQHINEF
jgi:hypothetical protein